MRYWKSLPIVGQPRVGMAIAAYTTENPKRQASLLALLHSLRAQTYDNWLAFVMHDGPMRDDHREQLRVLTGEDKRIVIAEAEERKQHFGHPHRQATIDALLMLGADWIGLSNDDNYYAPIYFEWMLYTAVKDKKSFVYCDMVHSHERWKFFKTEPKYKHLDLGGFLATAALCNAVKFDKKEFNADGDYINRLVAKAGKRTAKVPAVLFVHN